jgi:hypothetical protein
MPIRGNKPVGPTAKILIMLTAAAIIATIVVGILGARSQHAYPERGAAALPGQAAAAGAQPNAPPTRQ